MEELISVAKAARLLGVPRLKLQQLIHRGDLSTFEGKLSLVQLRDCFPSIALKESREHERLEYIRQSAYATRVQSVVAPETDEIEKRLAKRSLDLNIERACVKKYRSIIDNFVEHLTQMGNCEEATEVERELVGELRSWLVQELKK